MMRRREFIAGLGSSAAALPLVAHAQQPGRMRRIAMLNGYDENNPFFRGLATDTFRALAQMGWEGGRNVQVFEYWSRGDINRAEALAKEVVALQPDVILANSTPVTAALKHETATIPIVFAVVADPVGSGFVASLPHPGGNVTGFSSVEA